ncbi:MAG TPA: hypothetical protein VHV27_07985 [Phenylobacterium sp.]|jgi:hypothetical protein|nr:hypothetical protein [Phenylobacterium sp.]
MIMWIRVGGALALTWAALGCLDYFGVTALVGGRSGDNAVHTGAQQTWSRDLFWFAIFAVVMMTALLAAARRGVGKLRRSLAKA